LCGAASFHVEAEDDVKPAHPPKWLVEGVDSLGGWPGVHPLEGVVEAPVLMPDGTLLQTPGFHADSGLLYEPSADYPPIPGSPTLDDARKSLVALLDAVVDFPFGRPEHRPAWLAALLTALARNAFEGPAPLFLVDANIRGAGKGLLLDPLGLIATGRNLARATATTDDNEMKKTITAIALQGEAMVLLDNLAGALGSPSLDAALTATDWQGRILGKTSAPRLPLLVTWFAAGNNVVLLGDTLRRVCHIRLDSPEERQGFSHPDLLRWATQERPRLLAAAWTILTGDCAAGRPDQGLRPWGSFEGWSALVRGAVVWVGLPDPGETRLEVTGKADREANALRGLLEGWRELEHGLSNQGDEGITVSQALRELKGGTDELAARQAKYPLLWEVLPVLFDLPPDKLPSSQRLGMKLRAFAGRYADGRCFVSRETHGGVQSWYVSARSPGGTGGTGGTSTPNPSAREGSRHSSSDVEERLDSPTSLTSPTEAGTVWTPFDDDCDKKEG
jgi:hypothetical protein